jgi:hypothetical protein
MKPTIDRYAADRRDPAVKKLEREGLNALLRALSGC